MKDKRVLVHCERERKRKILTMKEVDDGEERAATHVGEKQSFFFNIHGEKRKWQDGCNRVINFLWFLFWVHSSNLEKVGVF